MKMNTWNYELLRQLFSPQCVQEILKLPLGRRNSEDQNIWSLEHHGKFTVKTAYLLDQADRFICRGPINSKCWQKLWKWKIQARLKLFAWKVTSNALPTRGRIATAITSVDEDFNCCQIYHHGAETCEHLFLECPIAQIIWKEGLWPMNFTTLNLRSIDQWILILCRPHKTY